MRICIYGAGATGGLLGGRLAAAGHDVSLITRGAHLTALREKGLELHSAGETFHVRPLCTDDPAECGPQDYVIVMTKAHGVAEAVGRLAPLLGPDTAVVFTQNGLPWWYFQGLGGPHAGRRLRSVDRDGRIAETMAPERVIGGVVAAACAVPEPGVVRHGATARLMLGEPDGATSARCELLAAAVGEAGIDAAVTPRIRDEIWVKLWGNVSFSQLAVLTRAGLTDLANDPAIESLARTIMTEAQAVGAALGAGFPRTIEQRIEATKQMGNHRTSILQDLEAGRPMEIDAQVGAVIEAGRIARVATPVIEMIYALVRRRAIEAGCYPGDPDDPPFDIA